MYNITSIFPDTKFGDEDIVMLPASEKKVVDYIIMASSSLGLCGSLFIMITFLLFKEVRIFSTKLIFFLSLSDFMASISWYPFGHVNEVFCYMQAIGLHFFLCSSFLWTMCISLSLFFAFYSQKIEHMELSRSMKIYHIVCWGIPFVSVTLCAMFGEYDNSGAWCFIVPNSWFRLLYYVPLMIAFLINFGVFIAIRLKIEKYKFSIEAKMNVIVSFYMVAFIVSQLPSIINGTQNFLSPHRPVFVLYILHALFQPLQGFLNSIVYGMNEGFVSQYVQVFTRYCCKCNGDTQQDEIDTDGLLEAYDYHSDDE